MKKVLISDYVHPILKSGLEDLGYEVDYRKSITLDEVRDIISEYSGIIINSKIKMNAALIDKASQLKFIGRLGSGLEIIDLAYAESKNIQVFNSPEGNRNAVAEHALGMLLTLANKFISGKNEVKQESWDRESHRGFELKGKTIGIIGYGHTGSSFAKVLSGLSVNVLVYDKYKNLNELDLPNHVQNVSVQEIQKKSDIISFHLPLTEETLHLVDEDYIHSCKKGVILINTSRGQLIKTQALINGLYSKSIYGLCLDVFENEKPLTYSKEQKVMFEKLFDHDQVIATPHVAGWTHESLARIAETLIYKIKKYVDTK